MLSNPVVILFLGFLLYSGIELYNWAKVRHKKTEEPNEVQKIECIDKVETLQPGVPYQMVQSDVFEIEV